MRWLVRIVLTLIALLGALFLIFRVPDTDPEEMRAKYAGEPSQFVTIEDGVSVHLRDEGPRDAPAIVLLHGSNADLHTWQPWVEGLRDEYRVIRFDQVGHGLTGADPDGDYSLDNFVSDIDQVADALGLERFILGGNSMGGSHTVAYAMAHPSATTALTLYGLFLARQHELAALYFKGGVAASMFPDVFAAFMKPLAPDQQANPINGYAKLFQSPDEAIRRDALNRWTTLEKAVSRLILDETQMSADLSDPDFVLAHSLIENHYFRHHGFINADDILQRAGQTLADIPIDVISSRYDIVCPPQTAFDFARAVPHTNLTVVPNAGHTWRDPSNTQALLQVLNAHKDAS